jgi:ElaB/YqjD/DUF883 family membrane-anchored ribosome-binding protein
MIRIYSKSSTGIDASAPDRSDSLLAEGALWGAAAVVRTGTASREQLDALMDKGRNVIEDASELIREHPLSALGMAAAAGWIIASLSSMGSANK